MTNTILESEKQNRPQNEGIIRGLKESSVSTDDIIDLKICMLSDQKVALVFFNEYMKLKSDGQNYKDRCIYAEIAVEKYIEKWS